MYWIMAFIAKIFFRFAFFVRFIGKENIPKEGGYILCSNHKSVADPIMLTIPFYKKVHYMAKIELFTEHGKLASSFLKSLGAFPVNRNAVDRSSISTAEELIAEGKIVAIFPQGTCIRDDDLSFKPKAGAALLSAQTKAGILPVSIYSEGRIRPFKRITVRIGEMIRWEDLGFKEGSLKESRAATKIIAYVITKQLEKKHSKK